MSYTVAFSLEATADLLRIVGVVGLAQAVIHAADTIQSRLAVEPADVGTLLSDPASNGRAAVAVVVGHRLAR